MLSRTKTFYDAIIPTHTMINSKIEAVRITNLCWFKIRSFRFEFRRKMIARIACKLARGRTSVRSVRRFDAHCFGFCSFCADCWVSEAEPEAGPSVRSGASPSHPHSPLTHTECINDIHAHSDQRSSGVYRKIYLILWTKDIGGHYVEIQSNFQKATSSNP